MWAAEVLIWLAAPLHNIASHTIEDCNELSRNIRDIWYFPHAAIATAHKPVDGGSCVRHKRKM